MVSMVINHTCVTADDPPPTPIFNEQALTNLSNICPRTWHHESATGTFVLAAISTERPDVPIGAVRAKVFSCVHLLEPVGAKRTRLTHVCREDTR